MVSTTYASVEAMEADIDNPNIEVGDFVIIATDDVDDPDNAKLYVKAITGTTLYWDFITDLSGAQGIQGPQGEQGIQGVQGYTGNSLSADFSGNTLTITEKDHTGAEVSSESYDMLGQIGISASFDGPILTVTTKDYEGQETTVSSDDLTGPRGPQGLPAESTTPGELIIRYIGDGASREFDVIHNLGTTHPFWQVQDVTGAYPEYVDVFGYAKTANILHLVFDTAPSTNGIAVMISSGLGTGVIRTKYEWSQLSASATWTITHNLGRKTSFTITDTAGTVIWCDEYVQDENTTIEYFGAPTAGYAIER